MLRKTILEGPPVFLTPDKKRKCFWISNLVLAQCILAAVGGVTITQCIWRPNIIEFDPYKLASVMYLYDREACELTSLQKAKVLRNLKLSNDTRGFNVLPLRWQPVVATVAERVSSKTRMYIVVSMTFHCLWALLSVIFRCIVASNKNARLLSIAVNVYFYTFTFIACFDLSMAIVYLTHIQNSLTKGMIVRHAGWSIDLYIRNRDDFAGYLPLVAAAFWLRGVIFFALNVYSCKIINDIRYRINKKNILLKFSQHTNIPFPEPVDEEFDTKTLYFRAGEINQIKM